MRNRNYIYKKLDLLEAKLANLERIVSTQQPISEYHTTIEQTKGIVDEIRSVIEAETMSGNEINRI
tara:strand:- start:524 stop:721 length:198 start_codon:yes stop_codon:yes gene_type:complete